jgi:hypothetical protein
MVHVRMCVPRRRVRIVNVVAYAITRCVHETRAPVYGCRCVRVCSTVCMFLCGAVYAHDTCAREPAKRAHACASVFALRRRAYIRPVYSRAHAIALSAPVCQRLI